MIAKGNTHNNGARLATYITRCKADERVELFELRGFAAATLREAFRDVQIMGDGIAQCEKPFFHVYVRNPQGEHLDAKQWARVADRIESKSGLTGQPRA